MTRLALGEVVLLLCFAGTIVCKVSLISEKAHWIWGDFRSSNLQMFAEVHKVTFSRIRGNTVSLKSSLSLLKAILSLILNISISNRRKKP